MMIAPKSTLYASKFRGKSRVQSRYTKKSKLSSAGMVKAALLKNLDSHHATVSDGTAFAAAMVSNTLYTHNVTQNVPQGTTNATRIGDKIHMISYSYNGFITSNIAAGAYSYRVMLLWSGEEFSNTGLSSGLGSTQIFLPNSGTNMLATSLVNPKAVTVIDDFTVDINSQISATSDVVTWSRTIPIRKDFMYKSTGSTYGKTKNLYVVVMGYVSGGTTGVTGVGAIGFSDDLCFKPL